MYCNILALVFWWQAPNVYNKPYTAEITTGHDTLQLSSCSQRCGTLAALFRYNQAQKQSHPNLKWLPNLKQLFNGIFYCLPACLLAVLRYAKCTCQDEVTLNSEIIKPIALADIELCLPEGIKQAGRQAVCGFINTHVIRMYNLDLP